MHSSALQISKERTTQLENTPLTFTALSAGSKVALVKYGSPTSISIVYRTKNSDWTTCTVSASSSPTYITLQNAGDYVQFKAADDSTLRFSTGQSNRYTFYSTGSFKISGNLQYLLTSSGTSRQVTAYCFYYLFYASSATYQSIVDASDLVLPATELNTSCYRNMFYNQANLQKSPKILPAMTLKTACYQGMFYKCTALRTTPYLPAHTLISQCYQNMFRECSNVDFVDTCMKSVYSEALTSASPITVTNYSDATSNWLASTKSTGTIRCPIECGNNTTIPRTTEAGTIPPSWTVVNANSQIDEPLCFTAKTANTQIQLTRATSMTLRYFQYMTDTTYWTDLESNIITLANVGDKVWIRSTWTNDSMCILKNDNIYHYTFNIVQGSAEASGNIMYLLERHGEQSEIISEYCFAYLFDNCTGLLAAPELPSEVLTDSCYSHMFQNCTDLIKGPSLLPAKTLTNYCYYYMFRNCGKMKEIRTLQTSFTGCDYWLIINQPSLYGSGVDTFYCSSALGTNDTISRGNFACPKNATVINYW